MVTEGAWWLVTAQDLCLPAAGASCRGVNSLPCKALSIPVPFPLGGVGVGTSSEVLILEGDLQVGSVLPDCPWGSGQWTT